MNDSYTLAEFVREHLATDQDWSEFETALGKPHTGTHGYARAMEGRPETEAERIRNGFETLFAERLQRQLLTGDWLVSGRNESPGRNRKEFAQWEEIDLLNFRENFAIDVAAN